MFSIGKAIKKRVKVMVEGYLHDDLIYGGKIKSYIQDRTKWLLKSHEELNWMHDGSVVSCHLCGVILMRDKAIERKVAAVKEEWRGSKRRTVPVDYVRVDYFCRCCNPNI